MTTTTGQWSFTRWTTIGQLEAIDVRHPLFSARLFLQGAHLTHYAPASGRNWLWISETASYQTGRAIRGGIPVCWPWFGDPDRNPPEVRNSIRTSDAHGFARTAVWKLEDVRESAQDIEISLSLNANQDFSHLWDGRAQALLTFRFTATGCQLALTTTNAGARPLAFTQALHTYLPTNDITATRIRGLEGARYLDALNHWKTAILKGPVGFSGETDRIYENSDSLVVATPTTSLRLTPAGSGSTVVWNPGPEKARRLSDFPAAGWRHMLCVETANAAEDYRVLEEGQSHTLALMLERI